MAYIAIKKINGRHYAYRQESFRDGGTVRTRIVDYLGAVEPALAQQAKSKTIDAKTLESAIVKTSERPPPPSETPEASQNPQTTTQKQEHSKAALRAPKEPITERETKTVKAGDEWVEVDAKTGEVLRGLGRFNTTDKANEKPNRPFHEGLKLPPDLEAYDLSTTALERTHHRFGQRLKALQINPSAMADVSIQYGHPDRLVKNRNGSFTVYASRRSKNKRHKIAKAKLWENYRQALAASYLEAIRTERPHVYHHLATELDHCHRDSKSALLSAIQTTTNPTQKLVLTLQLKYWNRLSLDRSRKAQPEDFGQISFDSVNDWKAETITILSEVQKSGWDGLAKRQANAERRLKSAITKQRNQLDDMGKIERFTSRLSGKKRRILREILEKENRLKAAQNLKLRLKAIKQTLPS